MRLTQTISNLLLLLFACTFTACEEEYVLESVDFESKLVVHSLFTHGLPWQVDVTNTKFTLDNSQTITSVEDARVEIYGEDGVYKYDLYYTEQGYFTNGDHAPDDAQCYTVKVSAAGYRDVLAKNQIPEGGEVDVRKKTIYDLEGNEDTEISFTIGKAQEDTYVVWDIYKSDSINIGEDRSLTTNWLNQLANNPSNVVFGSTVNVGQTETGDITTTLSSLIDNGKRGGGTEGGPGQVDVAASNIITKGDLTDSVLGDGDDETDEGGGSGGDSSEDEAETYSYELRVMTISKELHEYYRSVEEYLKYNPSSTDIQPSTVSTNVVNGFGIFAGYHEQVVKF